jgi:hypothetical protein
MVSRSIDEALAGSDRLDGVGRKRGDKNKMSLKPAAGTNAAYNSQDFGTSHWRLINQATSGARCAKGARPARQPAQRSDKNAHEVIGRTTLSGIDFRGR